LLAAAAPFAATARDKYNLAKLADDDKGIAALQYQKNHRKSCG
jgi:hypothetical protein